MTDYNLLRRMVDDLNSTPARQQTAIGLTLVDIAESLRELVDGLGVAEVRKDLRDE